MIVVSLLFGTPQSLFYMGAALVNGLVYGHGVRKQKPNEWLLGVTILITAVAMFVTTYTFAAFFGYNVMEEVKLIIDYLKSIKGFVVDATMTATLYAMYPIVILTTAIIQSILTHLSAILLMKRLRIAVLPLRPINQIKVSKPVGWVALVLLFSPIIASYFHASLDISVMANLIYLIALLVFLFETFIFLGLLAPVLKIRMLPTIGLLLYILLPSIMTYVCIVIGALDILTDFRQRVLNRR